MDPIHEPDQMVAAWAHVAHEVLHGGVADLRPTPRTLIDEGPLRELHHYRPAGRARGTGDPVIGSNPERRLSSAGSRVLATAGKRPSRSAG